MRTTLIDMKMIQYEDEYDFVRLMNEIRKTDRDRILLVFQPVDESLNDCSDFNYVKKEEENITYFKIPCLKRRLKLFDFDYFRFLFTKVWYKEVLKDHTFLANSDIYVVIDVSSEEDKSGFATEDLRRFAAIVMNEMYHFPIDPDEINIYVMAKEVKVPHHDIPADLFRESFEYVGKRDVRSKKDKKKKKKGKKNERNVREMKRKW